MTGVSLSVCPFLLCLLLVSRITQKVMGGFARNLNSSSLWSGEEMIKFQKITVRDRVEVKVRIRVRISLPATRR